MLVSLRSWPSHFHVSLLALAVSLAFNVFTSRKLLQKSANEMGRHSYEGDDYPNQLPLHLPPVAVVYQDSDHYGIADVEAWGEWKTTDVFSKANGFVRLGPKGRPFGLSMFHQMHCLQMIRGAILASDSDYDYTHTRHCLNLIRQGILCAADTTLDPLDVTDNGRLVGTDGLGQAHVCRNWEKVYEFVSQNQLSDAWNVSSKT